jgi:hypothetical protein
MFTSKGSRSSNEGKKSSLRFRFQGGGVWDEGLGRLDRGSGSRNLRIMYYDTGFWYRQDGVGMEIRV